MTLKKLYNYIENFEINNSPFESEEEKAAYLKSYEKLIEPFYGNDISAKDEANNVLISLVTAERENAFKVGFKTALNLLMSNLNE